MASALLIVALLFAPPAEKKRAWMDGKVLNVEMKQELKIETGDPRTGGQMTGTERVMSYTYTIEANGTRYACKEQATKARFAEGQSVKIAIEKKNWYILDEKGKENKGDVIGHKELKKP